MGDYKSDKEFYGEIWDEREHYCEECGAPLGEPKVHYFAHIWSKGSNANVFRHDKRNIILLCMDCHHHLDCGDKTTMYIYDFVQETIEKLKREYYER